LWCLSSSCASVPLRERASQLRPGLQLGEGVSVPHDEQVIVAIISVLASGATAYDPTLAAYLHSRRGAM
jgi:hypothetical protein